VVCDGCYVGGAHRHAVYACGGRHVEEVVVVVAVEVVVVVVVVVAVIVVFAVAVAVVVVSGNCCPLDVVCYKYTYIIRNYSMPSQPACHVD